MAPEQNTASAQRVTGSWKLLLIAAAFLFSQTLTLSHLHVDEVSSADCATCFQSDNSPAAVCVAHVATATPTADVSAPALLARTYPSRVSFDHLSRAPPVSS